MTKPTKPAPGTPSEPHEPTLEEIIMAVGKAAMEDVIAQNQADQDAEAQPHAEGNP